MSRMHPHILTPVAGEERVLAVRAALRVSATCPFGCRGGRTEAEAAPRPEGRGSSGGGGAGSAKAGGGQGGGCKDGAEREAGERGRYRA